MGVDQMAKEANEWAKHKYNGCTHDCTFDIKGFCKFDLCEKQLDADADKYIDHMEFEPETIEDQMDDDSNLSD